MGDRICQIKTEKDQEKEVQSQKERNKEISKETAKSNLKMTSIYFRIEVYGLDNYGCPELGLMGYSSIKELLWDCWTNKFGKALE